MSYLTLPLLFLSTPILGLEGLRLDPCIFNPHCGCSKSFLDLGSVKCQNVPLPKIPATVNFSKVYSLHLENNGLRSLEPYFLRSTELYRLEISNNPISEVPDEAFDGLERSLRDLVLRDNHLTEVPNRALRFLQRLRLLDLTGNDIVTYNLGSWKGLGNSLSTLILKDNAITYLPPNAFHGLPMLETIDLEGNSLKQINPDIFREGMGHLRNLLFGHNLLHEIPYEALTPLKSLRHLDLSYNRITKLLDDRGKNTSTKLVLDSLILDHNDIVQLPTGSFFHFEVINTSSLDGNPLKTIEVDAFRPCKIKDLFLRNCELSEVSPEAFGGLESSLQHLDLSGNNISDLPHNFLHSFNGLEGLELEDNTYDLDPIEAFGDVRNSLTSLYLKANRLSLKDFKGISNLRSLTLTDLTETLLEPETFLDYGVNVETLSLTYGRLQTIKNFAFKHLRGLKEIRLCENNINGIETDAFSDVGLSLRSLDLSHAFAPSMNRLTDFLRPLTDLEYLNLNNNGLKVVPDNSFHFQRSLKHLLLQDNEVEAIIKGTFQSDIHKNLEDIMLSFNNIREIHQHTFANLPALVTAYLDDNRIDRLHPKSFVNLEQLKFITLKGNKIESLQEETFQNLPVLEYLDASFNSLKSFNFNALDQVGSLSNFRVNASYNKIQILHYVDPEEVSLENCPHCLKPAHSSIKILDLSHNNISLISGSFFKPTRLQHLYLSHNQLNNITWVVFGSMPFLQTLDISSNRIGWIEPEAFKGTRRIETFLASNNNLEEIKSDVFRPLTEVRIVDLSHNRLKSLQDNTFFGDRLEILDLSDNNLVRMPLESLSYGSATSICELDLSRNSISSIKNAELFVRLPSLKKLDLSHNRIFQIFTGMFSSLHHLKVLDLSHNYELEVDPDGKSFLGLDDTLEYLNLDNVTLEVVPELPLSNLKYLSLASNELMAIPLESFVNLSQLLDLNLANNLFITIPLVVRSLSQLRKLTLAGNPINVLANDSFYGVSDSLQELDLRHLPLSVFEVGTLSKLNALKMLKISSFGDVNGFNIPQLLEDSALESLHIEVDSVTSLSGEMTGSFPKTLREIIISGRSLNTLSSDVLRGISSPNLSLTLTNTSLTSVSNTIFQDLDVRDHLEVNVEGNQLRSLENPSAGRPDTDPVFLSRLKVLGNSWKCDCGIGWIELWLRKIRQHSCNKNLNTAYNDDFVCYSTDDDLRLARCSNKGNESLLEVLKNDLECGWNSAIRPITSSILIFSTLMYLLF